MKILVTGSKGQLGHDLMYRAHERGYDAVGADLAEMDITDPDSVGRFMGSVLPDAVIHCAAWTAVDSAEDPANFRRVRLVNSCGTRYIADNCRKFGCKMIYISTDYVFNGNGIIPWDPDCRDFDPLNFYGRTKLEGEYAVSEILEKFFIVRIAWAFGKCGSNFIDTMLRLARSHDSVRVVNDQIGTPTCTYDLARLLLDMCESDKYGFYHATNEGGYISWYDFAREIFRQAGLDTKVIPVSTAQYGLNIAARPFNSRLDKSKLAKCGFRPLPDWQDALSRYLNDISL